MRSVPLAGAPDFDAIASRTRVDRGDLELAVKRGREGWSRVARYFPDPLVEVRLDSEICGGTADVISIVRDPAGRVLAIRILDWKTGHGTDRHRRQLEGYAYCAMRQHGMPSNGVITIYEVWTTHRRIEATNLRPEDLEAFEAQLLEIVRMAGGGKPMPYRAGSHCGFCPHRSACATRAGWLRDATTALAEVDHETAITPELLGSLYDRARAADQALRRYWAAVDAALDDGPIPLPDGREVRRVETTRTKIAAAPALAALEGRFDRSAVAEILGDVSKKSLETAIRRSVPKGGGAAAIREIYRDLRKAGAIREVPHRERKIVDK